MTPIGIHNGNSKQRGWMNDPELGEVNQTGTIVLCGCGGQIENPWYGSRLCYECKREFDAEYARIFPDMERIVLHLLDAVAAVYMDIPAPDPLAFVDDWAADPEWLNSATQEEQDEWYKGVQPIEF